MNLPLTSEQQEFFVRLRGVRTEFHLENQPRDDTPGDVIRTVANSEIASLKKLIADKCSGERAPSYLVERVRLQITRTTIIRRG